MGVGGSRRWEKRKVTRDPIADQGHMEKECWGIPLMSEEPFEKCPRYAQVRFVGHQVVINWQPAPPTPTVAPLAGSAALVALVGHTAHAQTHANAIGALLLATKIIVPEKFNFIKNKNKLERAIISFERGHTTNHYAGPKLVPTVPGGHPKILLGKCVWPAWRVLLFVPLLVTRVQNIYKDIPKEKLSFEMKAKLHKGEEEEKSDMEELDDKRESVKEEEDEGVKPRSRQSKRNINKIVKYHEFEDDNSGEEEVIRPKGRQSKRRAEDSEDDDFFSEGHSKGKGTPGGRSRKRTKVKKTGEEEEGEDDNESGVENRKNRKDKSPAPKKVNQTESDYSSIDFSSDKTTKDGKPWNLKISSWNVGGLKAWVKKNGLEFLKHENPDVFCVQETKCSESKLPSEAKVDGYHTYWLMGEKEGYAGVALYSKDKPIEVKYGLGDKEHDSEGRLITAEFEQYYLVVAYVPNAGRGLVTLPKRRKWDPDLRAHLKELDAKKPVIICGDMNVSHEAIDLANPKTNTKNAGFTQEERDGMTALLKDGFVDTFRHLYPDKTGSYTFWTYMGNARSRNVGWRLDYFIISERLVPNLCDNVIRSQVYGSDHCPITLLLHM